MAEHDVKSDVFLLFIVGGTPMASWAIVILMSILLGETALSVVEIDYRAAFFTK
jgi:hypothetical protein